MKLSVENGLEGIVSEIKGIFRDPATVTKIKESKLCLLSYGKLKYACFEYSLSFINWLRRECFLV